MLKQRWIQEDLQFSRRQLADKLVIICQQLWSDMEK